MRVAFVLVLVATACGPAPAPVAPLSNNHKAPAATHEPLATLQRTACFGWCPAYKVTIYRDGVVEYDGEAFVKTKGRASGHLDADELAALDELFQKHGYLGLKDAYDDHDMTDMPSAHTSYAPEANKTKSIQHYFGDGSAPHALIEVEAGIDRIVHIERWIGTEEEREKMSHR